MTILRRIRLDLGPAFWALLALWAMALWCERISEGDQPWSVLSALRLGYWIAGSWWIVSDSIRRGYRLIPVWGLYLTLIGWLAVLVYLFRTRGWWAFLTLALYLLAFVTVGIAFMW